VVLAFAGCTTAAESMQIQLLLTGLSHLNRGMAAISLCITGLPSQIWKKEIRMILTDIPVIENLCLWQEDED
jgi:hypothetical protein